MARKHRFDVRHNVELSLSHNDIDLLMLAIVCLRRKYKEDGTRYMVEEHLEALERMYEDLDEYFTERKKPK